MNRHAPHNTRPERDSVRVVLCYKNFAAARGISHIGLGCAAMNTQATLRAMGYWVEVWPCANGADLRARLASAQSQAMHDRTHPVSHVVISAPWIPTPELQSILMQFSGVDFALVSHSNVGFLQADPGGIQRLREASDLVLSHHNFRVAGNCAKFAAAWSTMYGRPVLTLPNLYNVSTIRNVGQRVPWRGAGALRVGIFGAERPLKNMVTATAAAIELAARLRVDVEVLTSAGRSEGGGSTGAAIRQLVGGLSNIKLTEIGWRPWPQFRTAVAQCHVLLNVSYTESFNMVTADGIAEGVASVVGDAIDWVPHDWVANDDNVDDVARIARRLLGDAHAVDAGQTALRKYVADGSLHWQKYLEGRP